MKNAINWFEIPSVDFDRAVDFYSNILKKEIRKEIFSDVPSGIFPAEDPGVGGAIIKSDAVPSTGGPIIYLNVEHDMAGVLGRVEAAGGKVAMPKTSIGPMGIIAAIIDSEGNRIGLHSDDQE